MSLASRQRDRERTIAASPYWAYRRGLITLPELRERQATLMGIWRALNRDIPARDVYVRDAWGRVSQPPRLFSTVGTGEQVPMTYPEPVAPFDSLDSQPQSIAA